MADAPLLDMDYLSWSRHYRCFPGQGDLAVDDFMEALQATGFDGLLSLEIFNDRFRAGSARSVAVDGQRSLLFMLDQLQRRTGVTVSGPAGSSAAGGMPRRGVRRVRHGRAKRERPSSKSLGGLGFAKAGKPSLEGRRPAGGRATSTSS